MNCDDVIIKSIKSIHSWASIVAINLFHLTITIFAKSV